MTVLPGLIDAHIHSLDFFPQLFLHFGVTTVYDTANPTEWVIAQRDALSKDRIKGPRMFVTGVVVDGPDSVPDRRDEYRVHVSTATEMFGIEMARAAKPRAAGRASAAARTGTTRAVTSSKSEKPITPGHRGRTKR